MIKKLTIYGKPTTAGFSYTMMSGDPAGTDAFNTMMQLFRFAEHAIEILTNLYSHDGYALKSQDGLIIKCLD